MDAGIRHGIRSGAGLQNKVWGGLLTRHTFDEAASFMKKRARTTTWQKARDRRAIPASEELNVPRLHISMENVDIGGIGTRRRWPRLPHSAWSRRTRRHDAISKHLK